MSMVFSLAAWLFPVVVVGQPGDPGGDPDVPITGIEILIGVGAGYGLSRKWLRKNQEKD